MAAPETIPLNLEPNSGIYRDPVVVLDFQSLYPSICIAYNYCFSTCLGKISAFKKTFLKDLPAKLGALDYEFCKVDLLKTLIHDDMINISPVGGIFVKRELRCGLLATMLHELLDTRVMVKKAIKIHKNCQVSLILKF